MYYRDATSTLLHKLIYRILKKLTIKELVLN